MIINAKQAKKLASQYQVVDAQVKKFLTLTAEPVINAAARSGKPSCIISLGFASFGKPIDPSPLEYGVIFALGELGYTVNIISYGATKTSQPYGISVIWG
jgi:hypothetical protein